ncbi:MAG TPA: hypothetical protein VNW89_15915 [Stellaceae bacterium]|nr:hypothetical protein [Stellaceae bacterium]
MNRPIAARGLFKVARLGLASSLLGLLPPAELAAQQGPARQACSTDISRLCAGIQPGEGRITGCIREDFINLSAPCKTALISGATITKACKADYQLRCAGIEPGGGRSQACMKDHFAELDERCQQALLLGKLQRQ